jgi:hypothetical protein
MAETVDDLHPLALRGRLDYVALAKTAAKIAVVIVPSIISIVAAVQTYRSGRLDASEKAQATKDKAESGYQVTRHAVEELEHRVLVLETAAKRTETVAHQVVAAKGKPLRKQLPAPAVVVTRARPLPGDLDKAERAVLRTMAGPPPAQAPPSPDAGP